LADACVYLMKNYNESGLVNIGCGEDLTIKALAEMVKDIVGYSGAIVWNSTKPDGTPRKLMSVEKLKSFGWTAKIGLREGISGVVEQRFKR